MTDWQPKSTKGNLAARVAPLAVQLAAVLIFVLWVI